MEVTDTLLAQEAQNPDDFFEVSDFGKDHWSLLAYVEYRCMNHNGVLDLKHLRIMNPVLRTQSSSLMEKDWQPEYGTRLHGYWNADGTTNKELLIDDHDDYDCLDDLENAGFIKIIGSALNPACELTIKGAKVCALLTLHKQKGEHFASFVLGESDD